MRYLLICTLALLLTGCGWLAQMMDSAMTATDQANADVIYVRAVENAILTRARQIRIRELGL